MAREQGPDQRVVRHRRVFYVPGYDPFHPRRYRELYRKEAAKQAEISGFEISQHRKATPGPYGWSVTAQMDGVETRAQVEVLVWSDIVRTSMDHGIARTYLQLVQTAWIYITTGALRRLMWLRKGPVLAALYPVVMLLAQLLIALGVGAFLGSLVARGLHFGANAVAGPEFLALPRQIASLALGLGVAGMILRWFRARDRKFYAYYLMHDYAFAARWRGANPPKLDARIVEFTDQIAEALTPDTDEVLIVGHSSGAHIAVSALADLIRQGRVPANGPALSFLSLGQVVPMMSFLPEAKRLRTDLHFLSARRDLSWIDITAPGDGCAFALCDPVAVSGVEPAGKLWPLVFSAAFTQTLSPALWKKLRWRFFRLHFQYLCAFDQPKDYDYFRVTAGPQTLAARYADRPPSRSRIDVSVSPHTSLAA